MKGMGMVTGLFPRRLGGGTLLRLGYDDIASQKWLAVGTWAAGVPVDGDLINYTIDSHQVTISEGTSTNSPVPALPANVLEATQGSNIFVKSGGEFWIAKAQTGGTGEYINPTDLLLNATVYLDGGRLLMGYTHDGETWDGRGVFMVRASFTWDVRSDMNILKWDELKTANGGSYLITHGQGFTTTASDKWQECHFRRLTVTAGNLELKGNGNPWGATGRAALQRWRINDFDSGPSAVTIGAGQTFKFSGYRQEIEFRNGDIVNNGTVTHACTTDPENTGVEYYTMMFRTQGGSNSGSGVLIVDGAKSAAQVGSGIEDYTNGLGNWTVKLRNGGFLILGSGAGSGIDLTAGGNIEMDTASTGHIRGAGFNNYAIMGDLKFSNASAVLAYRYAGDNWTAVRFNSLTLTTNAKITWNTSTFAPTNNLTSHRIGFRVANSVTGNGQLTVEFKNHDVFQRLDFFEDQTIPGGIVLIRNGSTKATIDVESGRTITLGNLTIDGSPVAPGTYVADTLSGFSGNALVVVQA